MIEECPKVSIWITSTGRYDCTKRTIDAFLKYNTYPNIEFLIFHSIPTAESMQTYNAVDVGNADVLPLFEKLLQEYPGKLWAEPWPPFGNALTILLNNSAEYFINLGDSNAAVCDGIKQINAGIKLLKAEKDLLALRLDLADESVFEGSDRFEGTKNVALLDTSYLYWKIYPISAQLVCTSRMKEVGFPIDHAIGHKNIVEEYPQARLRELPYVCGIDLEYKGFLHHINSVSTTNEDRKWRVDLYENCFRKGNYGKK